MRKITKSSLALVASAALVAGVSITPSLSSAWGDNGEGRRSYTINQINSGILGDNITFNSISNSTIGDEKNFVGARVNTGINAGAENNWHGNDITVRDGEEYLIRLYVHNNNPNGAKAVSRNTRVAFNLPTSSSKQVRVNGYIFSDNATPSQYWDYVNFNSETPFHLDYVYGSALLENNGIGANGGVKLGDEIVTRAASENGVQIGYDRLDGNIPGCYQYASYVTIRVKAVFDSDYTIMQNVRLAGTSGWGNYNVNAQVGDRVEFQSTYTNTGTERQDNVMIRTVLPRNLRYVPGSTKLYNSVHPNGATVDQDDIIDRGINIGNYNPGANAHIRFTAEVIDNNLECGSNTLVDWTQAGVGQKTIQDYSTVMVNKACTVPDVQEYKVRINYIYAETGAEAAPSYSETFRAGDPFTVQSPRINGYTADHAEISGRVVNSDLTYTVRYSQIPANYELRINYVDEDGRTVSSQYRDTLLTGARFTVASPAVEGYTALTPVVEGTITDHDLEYTVVYRKDAEQYRVRIHYRYADGTVAAPDYNQVYADGTEFSVNSPIINGYEADYSVVNGKIDKADFEWTVTYVAIRNTEPEQPEPSDPIVSDVDLPHTGASDLAGSALAVGALMTSTGYYVASRKALRK